MIWYWIVCIKIFTSTQFIRLSWCLNGTEEHEHSVLFDVNIMVICPLGLIAITRKLKVKWNKNYSGLRKLINHVLKASHMPIENVNVSCSFDMAASLFIFYFIYCGWCQSAWQREVVTEGIRKVKSTGSNVSLIPCSMVIWNGGDRDFATSFEQYSCQTNHYLNHYVPKTINHKIQKVWRGIFQLQTIKQMKMRLWGIEVCSDTGLIWSR